jgi:hypothetical protein
MDKEDSKGTLREHVIKGQEFRIVGGICWASTEPLRSPHG